MSHIAVKPDGSTSTETLLLTALNNLPVSATGEFIRKTGALTFENDTPEGGGGGTWGSITGTLSAQTDLNTSLNAKSNTALSNLESVAIDTALVLGTSDAAALGSTTKMWSDLFLASGGVINFNNGNVTLTHSAGLLTLNTDFDVNGHITLNGYARIGATDAFFWNTRSVLESPADGVIMMLNIAETGFTRLNLGGTTTSFPALGRNAANLIAKLADGSASTDLEVADEVYGAGWNGSLEVPTKNAVYDKIETLSSTSAKTLVPLPPFLMFGATGSSPYKAVTTSSNTTARAGKITVPFDITVNRLTFKVGNVTSEGILDIVIYAEDGQSQILSATTANIDTSNAVISTTISAVSVPAGVYYLLYVINGTGNLETWNYASEGSAPFGSSGLNEKASYPTLVGTLTVTAGTPPTTFAPSSDITRDNDQILVIRLDN